MLHRVPLFLLLSGCGQVVMSEMDASFDAQHLACPDAMRGSDAAIADAAPAPPPDGPGADASPCHVISLAGLESAPRASLGATGAVLSGSPGWLAFGPDGAGAAGLDGPAVTEGEELWIEWSQSNSAIDLSWHATGPVWVDRISEDGAASLRSYTGTGAEFAGARALRLWPDPGSQLVLAELSYCLD